VGTGIRELQCVADRRWLPDRFVRLVASAFGSGRIDLEDAARYFDTDADGAERILGQFEYEDNPQAAKGTSQ